MSALGTKRTSILAPHMSAFGGKADKYAAVEFHRLSALSWSRPRRYGERCRYKRLSF